MTNVKLRAFTLSNGEVIIPFRKIPSKLCAYAIDFMIYFAKQSRESLIYLNLTEKEEWILTVPKQNVTTDKITVDSRVDQLNLLTGLPVLGVYNLGSLHSHHSFKPEFTTTDDINDLQGPPAYHIVMGSFPNIEFTASVVYEGQRYYFPIQNLMDYKEEHSYQPNNLNRTVLRQVK